MLLLFACAPEAPEAGPSGLAAYSHTPGEILIIGTEGVTMYVMSYDDVSYSWELSFDGFVDGTPVEQAAMTGSMVSLAYDAALDGQTLYVTFGDETISWPLAVE